MSIIDNIFGFFVEEAAEHLSILEEGLLQLEKDSSLAGELIEPLFRSAHTLKGSANLVNVTNVGSIAHRLEDLLEAIRDGEEDLTSGRVDAMLFALDQMQRLPNRLLPRQWPFWTRPSSYKRMSYQLAKVLLLKNLLVRVKKLTLKR